MQFVLRIPTGMQVSAAFEQAFLAQLPEEVRSNAFLHYIRSAGVSDVSVANAGMIGNTYKDALDAAKAADRASMNAA